MRHITSGHLQGSGPWLRGVQHSVVAAVLTASMSLSALGQPAGAQGGPGVAEGSAWAPRAQARELALGVHGVLGRTDNVGRAGDAERRTSSYRGVGFDVDWGKEHRRMTAQVQGDIEWLRYSAEEVLEDDTQVWGSVDSLLGVELVPQRFGWDFEHRYGQARRDPFSAIGPANRDDVHVVTTGPRLGIPFKTRNMLQAGVTVSESAYRYREDLDGRTTNGFVGLSRQISRVAQVGLQYSKTDRDFDHDLIIGYEFENAAVFYQKRFATGGINASIGYGDVTRAGQSSSTAVGSFGWNKQVATRSALSISVSHQLTDAGQLFRQGGSVGGGSPGGGLFGQIGNLGPGNTVSDVRWRDVLLTDNPMERSSVGVGFSYTGDRTNWYFDTGVSADRFEADSSFDNDGAHLGFAIDRQLSREWEARLQWQVWRERFKSTGQRFDDIRSRISASRAFGPRLALELTAERNRRDRGANDFEENAYTATLAYRIRP